MAGLPLLLAAICSTLHTAEQAIPVTQCDPGGHICEGRCPPLPPGAQLPPEVEPAGLCLREGASGACVCWLHNPFRDRHAQTLFKCDVALLHKPNGTVEMRHVMCLPPPICFPPGLGCLIVPHCPCADLGPGHQYGDWHAVVALILSSRTPQTPPAQQPAPDKPPSDSREFSMKHLLFLLAFVVGPLLCWCLLTFFHEGKCRRKRPSPPETERGEDEPPPAASPLQQRPTAPKFESPPPYREQQLLEGDCGPPPSYEEAVRDPCRLHMLRVQDGDSE